MGQGQTRLQANVVAFLASDASCRPPRAARGWRRQAPAGTDADYFILETADRLGAYVISNDEFETYRERYPWIGERRVPFMIIHGEVEFYKDRLRG